MSRPKLPGPVARSTANMRRWRSDPTNAVKSRVARYGLAPDQYYALFELQENRCKICGVHNADTPDRLHVDHCHATGRVRGLLCRSCNYTVGLLDNIGWDTTRYRAYVEATS